MHKIINLISNFFYNKNIPPSMKGHVHLMDLMKNQIIQKYQNFEIWKKSLQGKRFIFFTIWPKKNVQCVQNV
jgi:hypothetical protein